MARAGCRSTKTILCSASRGRDQRPGRMSNSPLDRQQHDRSERKEQRGTLDGQVTVARHSIAHAQSLRMIPGLACRSHNLLTTTCARPMPVQGGWF
jgi:hypothetical protein